MCISGSADTVDMVAPASGGKDNVRPALWNPFRVRVQTGYQPGAAFIRIRGFSCPRLLCASLSGSVAHNSHKSHKSHRPPRLISASLSGSVAALTSSINANTLNAQMSPRTSFVDRVENALQVLFHAVGERSGFRAGGFAQVDADDCATRFADEVFCVCRVSGVQQKEWAAVLC